MFFTDFISVVSLVFDVGWLYQNFFYDYYNYTQHGLLSISNHLQTNKIDFATYVEIVRYLRLIRILSWIRIFYKSQKRWFKAKSYLDQKNSLMNINSMAQKNLDYLQFFRIKEIIQSISIMIEFLN